MKARSPCMKGRSLFMKARSPYRKFIAPKERVRLNGRAEVLMKLKWKGRVPFCQ